MMQRGFIFAPFFFAYLCFANAAIADDPLDLADPCTDAGNKFTSTSNALRARADELLAKWDASASPPDELKQFFVDAVREAIFGQWEKDPNIAALIAAYQKVSPGFDIHAFFFQNIYPKVVTPEQELSYVNVFYKSYYVAEIRPKLIAERAALETTIVSQHNDLDSACKQDFFDKVIRVTMGNASLYIKANTEAAKQEHGVIAQSIRLTSGISITDIEKNGILGGDGSELRKLANTAGGSLQALSGALNNLNKSISDIAKQISVPLPPLPQVTLPSIPIPPFPNPAPTIIPVPFPLPVPIPIPVPKIPPLPSLPHIDLPHF